MGRVVAGGDVDRPGRAMDGHGVGDGRRGGVALRQPHLDAVGGQHLGRRGGEILRLEALVVADDRAPAGQPLLMQKVANPWAQRRTLSNV